ncbi:hypothetical protein MmarC5_0623 [Methanococcus maripaludis C5]|uniref:Uncharacterized protein n=1 Tax=Methanococcus maripaludis (strain C5 / ATCC BAA-1333) TaxID=402880 RepID=A4FXK1_METM5|nr:hypothetical protein [Methanococcus maripaludis]ABO34935.1 hypothetical protein MmarC5_0623 [Methanococcus maripaludis C5]
MKNKHFSAFNNYGHFQMSLYIPERLRIDYKSFLKGRLEFRVLKDPKSKFLITLVHFLENGLIYELPFDPQLNDYSDSLTAEDLSIIIFNSTKMDIMDEKELKIPPELLESWNLIWEKSNEFESIEYSREYLEWLNTLYSYDIDTLFEKSEFVCLI